MENIQIVVNETQPKIIIVVEAGSSNVVASVMGALLVGLEPILQEFTIEDGITLIKALSRINNFINYVGSTFVYEANGGIEKSNNSVGLGGRVIDNENGHYVSIVRDTQNNTFSFLAKNENDDWYLEFKFSPGSGGLYISANNGSVEYTFTISAEEGFLFTAGNKYYHLRPDVGLVAEDNYSSSYTPRSLVDKEYVDSLQSSQPSQPFLVDEMISTSGWNLNIWQRLGGCDFGKNNSELGYRGVTFLLPDGEPSTSMCAQEIMCFGDFTEAEITLKIPFLTNNQAVGFWFQDAGINNLPNNASHNYFGFIANYEGLFIKSFYIPTSQVEITGIASMGAIADNWIKLKIKREDTYLIFYLDNVANGNIDLNFFEFPPSMQLCVQVFVQETYVTVDKVVVY